MISLKLKLRLARKGNVMKMNIKVRSVIKWVVYGILAGICIGVGGTVYLSVSNKFLGAFLFSLGLLTIVVFGFNLFTGKVGYIPLRKPDYIAEVICTLVGNLGGTALAALGVRVTRFGDTLSQSVAASVAAKTSDTLPSAFVLAMFCGMLMFIAVEGFRRSNEKGHTAVAALIVIMPVAVFILSGFNHSVADMYYLFLAGFKASYIPYLITVVFGNAVGGVLIPTALRFFEVDAK